MNLLKEKIKNKEKIIGMHVSLTDITSARIAGLTGFDYIWVDLEHSFLPLENILGYLIAIQSEGTAVIVRVPVNDFTYLKKVLEMGPDGIVFPMIKTPEQAKELIDATLYPPYGTRGYGPQHAVKYGFESKNDYIDNTCDNLCRFIQIEHKDAVDCIDELVKNDYIDGFIYGAMDLSGSIGEITRVFDENTQALMKKSFEVLKKNDKYVGISIGETTEESIGFWHDFGIDMISAGADYAFLRDRAVETKAVLEKIHKRSRSKPQKVYYNPDNLTKNIHCSLNAPDIYGKEATDWDDFSAKNRKWQSAPCITRAYGNLYMTFTGDNFGGDEQPNNYNVIIKSTDGEKWETVCVIDHFESVRMHEPILWTDNEGNLWHFWAQSYNWWDGRGGVWAIKIDDNDCYTLPKRLCDGVMATPPIQKENGDILLPVSIWKPWRDLWHHYPYFGNSGLYISKDKGETFRYVGGADAPDSTFDENTIVEADGKLYMTIRCEDSIKYSVSEDNGVSWSEPVKLMDHCSSRSYLAKLPSGNFVLVTNDDAKDRKNMTAFLYDEGFSNLKGKLLLDAKCAVSYPAGHVDTDGRIYVAYDYNRYVEEEIYYASFTEEDILNGKFSENSFTAKLVIKGENGKNTDKVFESGN